MSHRFIIYSRSYCHLCDDMRDALLALLGEQEVAVEMVDVDADQALVDQYDELVPVLMGVGEGQALTRICHHFLDAEAVKAFVAAVPQ